jgi:hypothetical protein
MAPHLDEANMLPSPPTPLLALSPPNLMLLSRPPRNISKSLSGTKTDTLFPLPISSKLTRPLSVRLFWKHISKYLWLKSDDNLTEGGLMDFSESMFLKSQGLGWNETSAVGGTGTSKSSSESDSRKYDLSS